MTVEWTRQLDTRDLETRVKAMYEEVALTPDRKFHFETGRRLAEHLGYPAADLDAIPAEAIDSFAGVGYFLDLAAITAGESVLDLGSGAGTDSFLAAVATGPVGAVIGVDMTAAQLAKATRLAGAAGITNASFLEGYIERPPVVPGSIDLIISNGAINLSPDKPSVFRPPLRLSGREDGWRSPTSSPRSSSPRESPATRLCGPHASAVRPNARTTWP